MNSEQKRKKPALITTPPADPQKSEEEMIEAGEGSTVEFKATLRWN